MKTYAPNSTLDLFKDFENGKGPMVKLAHLYEDQNGRVFIDGEYIDPNTKESFKDFSPSNMYGYTQSKIESVDGKVISVKSTIYLSMSLADSTKRGDTKMNLIIATAKHEYAHHVDNHEDTTTIFSEETGEHFEKAVYGKIQTYDNNKNETAPEMIFTDEEAK